MEKVTKAVPTPFKDNPSDNSFMVDIFPDVACGSKTPHCTCQPETWRGEVKEKDREESNVDWEVKTCDFGSAPQSGNRPRGDVQSPHTCTSPDAT